MVFPDYTRLLLPLPVGFAFARVLFFLRIFFLISGAIHGTELTKRQVLDGVFVSTKSWIHDVIGLKFSCAVRESE